MRLLFPTWISSPIIQRFLAGRRTSRDGHHRDEEATLRELHLPDRSLRRGVSLLSLYTPSLRLVCMLAMRLCRVGFGQEEARHTSRVRRHERGAER